jgi:hypothetical protein
MAKRPPGAKKPRKLEAPRGNDAALGALRSKIDGVDEEIQKLSARPSPRKSASSRD